MGRIEGKVAVITGGGSGIGRATALRFLEEGAKVIVADVNAANGEGTIAEAKARGHDAIRFVRTDVNRETDIEAAIRTATDTFGRLDVVYNNAGFGGAIGPLTEITAEGWDLTMATLLRGTFLGLKHGARALIAQGQGGSLISTASVAGMIGGVRALPYATAKAGVIQLTKRSATGLAPHRIRVNAIAPGLTDTAQPRYGMSEEELQARGAAMPLGRMGRPEDIGNVAVFLASDKSAFMTGQVVHANGGLFMAS